MALDKIIVALDTESKDEAMALVRALGDRISYYKIGSVLFSSYGPDFVKEVKSFSAGKKVFLDLKYHDIPNTVAKAIEQTMTYGVDMLTVHTIGGFSMLKAAVQAAEKSVVSLKPIILGVTVLTSIKTADLKEVGVNRKIVSQVKKMAILGNNAGLGGFVCSAKEIELVRKTIDKNKIIVVPGIRLSGEEKGDQQRVATPREAILAGADYLVMGRSIIKSINPQKVLDDIEADLNF